MERAVEVDRYCCSEVISIILSPSETGFIVFAHRLLNITLLTLMIATL